MTTALEDATGTLGIAELGKLLDRRPATIRMWERDGFLPKHLRAQRDSRNRRYWTIEQAAEISKWMRDTRRFPGSGLKGYDPTPERVAEQISRMRKTAA
jgi:DNA-binding transcriptional MerR regulator